MTSYRRRPVAAALLLLGVLGVACGDDNGEEVTEDDPTDDGAVTGSDLDGSMTVFAAASLTDVFGELGQTFEVANPAASVEFNFASSSSLREQILNGAPADVFASANESNLDEVVDAGEATGQQMIFAHNQLQIAVSPGNPAGVTGLADFGDADLLIGLCDEEVPCGEFAREALANAGVDPSIDTNEPDVRSLLTKIEVGELDAGIVYRSDVLASGGGVEGIDIPADQNVTASYPIVVLAAADDSDLAQAFVNAVLSQQGREILASYGFDPA